MDEYQCHYVELQVQSWFFLLQMLLPTFIFLPHVWQLNEVNIIFNFDNQEEYWISKHFFFNLFNFEGHGISEVTTFCPSQVFHWTPWTWHEKIQRILMTHLKYLSRFCSTFSPWCNILITFSKWNALPPNNVFAIHMMDYI